MRQIRFDKKFVNRWLNRLELKMKRTKLLSKPLYLTIESTNACNSRCIMCNKLKEYSDPGFKAGFMTRDIFEKALPWASYASWTCWGGFGEPFLHPHYGEWAEDLKNENAMLICFTNGIKLSKSLAEKFVDIQFDTLNISIGGATEQIYQAVRGVEGLEIMLKNLAYLNEVKLANNSKKPIVNFNIVAMNTVLPQLIDIVNLAARYKINAINMPDLNVQYEENVKESIWMNVDSAKKYINEAAEYASQFGIKFTPPTTEEYQDDCHHFFNMIQIAYDGTILSCPEERFILGNLNSKTIGEIWNDEFYQLLRTKYFQDSIKLICIYCNEWNKTKEALLKASINVRGRATGYEKYLEKNCQ